MPRPKGGIMSAQEEYLKNRDPKVLEDLYQQLGNLGAAIQRRTKAIYAENAALDVATDVCMRLMEQNEPVIKSAPSNYMKQAMFYKSKEGRPDFCIDDFEELPMEERDEEIRSYEDYTASLFNNMEDQSEAMQLAAAVIESRVNWHDIRRAIEDRDFRAEFTRKMKEIRIAVEKDL